MIFVNENASANRTIAVQLQIGGGTKYSLVDITLTASGSTGKYSIKEAITLAAGDKVHAFHTTSGATDVGYILSGVERDV